MNPSTTSQRLRVLLISEGTYPFFFGGVSTWCHVLVRGLPEVDFTLMSLIDSPSRKPTFELSENVVEFRPVPIWGNREYAEMDRKPSLLRLLTRKHINRRGLRESFLPAMNTFLRNLFNEVAGANQLAASLHSMYRFFLDNDFDMVMSDREVWANFVTQVNTHFPPAAARHGFNRVSFTMKELSDGIRWLRHMLIPIARPLPPVDVVHAAMAGMCSIVGVVAKQEYGSGFLLTEHGIYLRESYLAEAGRHDSLFLKFLHLRFARCMTEMSCQLADQISPCCDYNQRWEREMGADESQLQTIYYGLDTKKFAPAAKAEGGPPVVIWVGRINPLKDLETLIQAAERVHLAMPEVQFHLYGTPPAGDEPYYERLLALRSDLGLEETVQFRGFTAMSGDAFNTGDLCVLSSISEGFPYVIVEAMLCGKPTVATGVGGVPEQIRDCGIVVEPRNPQAMAEAIVTLLSDPVMCHQLGQTARMRAEQEFTVQKANLTYYQSYARLSVRARAQMQPDAATVKGGVAEPAANRAPSLAM